MKLKRATYRHIEAEIFSYHDTLKAIYELRQDIILAGRNMDDAGMPMSSDFSSSTVERRATKLADSLLLQEMQRITRAIEDVYLTSKSAAREVLWVKYGLQIMWEPPESLVAKMDGRNRHDLSVSEITEILSADDNTFHRYRTGFVYGIAERLGWW